MRKILMVALCLGILSCQHTKPAQDVLEVNFPAGTEGFVEIIYGVDAARRDTLPIVNGRLEVVKDSIPITVELNYLRTKDSDSAVWLAVQIASTRWGNFPLGYGRTVVTFDSLSTSLPVGTIVDDYGDCEAFNLSLLNPQLFRSKEFLKAHSQSVMALHELSYSWDADTLQMALDCFSEALRNSEKGQEIQQIILARKEKGEVAKLFPMWDTAGNAHTFEECLNGKEYMLLNLWASWCGPCRAEIPELIAYEEECRDRVAFVSVTIDEDRDAWLKAVDELPKCTWANLSTKFDGSPEGRPRPPLFNNGFVPFFYILDRDGNTVYSSLEFGGGKPLDDAKERLNELLALDTKASRKTIITNN